MFGDNVHELGLVALLYVSRSSLNQEDTEEQLAQIVSTARRVNARLNVTGALLFTGAHFAQALEGPEQAVAELMTSIERDARHRDVTTIGLAPIRERKFGDWAMAYSGTSPYLD
jgi:hypothetical protein